MPRGRPATTDIFTPREWQVLLHLRHGLTNVEIAHELGVSLAGAKYHVSEILSKLGVKSRKEAAEWHPRSIPNPEMFDSMNRSHLERQLLDKMQITAPILHIYDGVDRFVCELPDYQFAVVADNPTGVGKKIISQIATLLVELHSALTSEQAIELTKDVEMWPASSDWVRERLPHVLNDQSLLSELYDVMDQYDQLEIKKYVLCQGDPTFQNLAFNDELDLNNESAYPDAIVRAVEPEDYPSIQAIYAQRGKYFGTLQSPYPSQPMWKDRLDAQQPGFRALVACVDDVPVGNIGLSVIANPRRRHAAHVGMGVHDDFAGRGVGQLLMQAALDLADNWLNLLRVELTVFSDNERAVRLYKRSGFEVEGTLRKYAFRDGEYVDAFAMARFRPD